MKQATKALQQAPGRHQKKKTLLHCTNVHLCSYQIDLQEKQEQIVLERSARLKLDAKPSALGMADSIGGPLL